MKYVLGALGVIALILVFVILLFNRGGNPNVVPKTQTQLVDYADKSSSVSLTTIGSVVGNDAHRSIRITVTPTQRRIEVLSGYNNTVERSQTYGNTKEAYATFLSALSGLGYLKDKKTSITDERSVCPTGQRYVFDLKEGNEEVTRLWAVSCGSTGTFAGERDNVRKLFERQITDYGAQVRGVRLR